MIEVTNWKGYFLQITMHEEVPIMIILYLKQTMKLQTYYQDQHF
jgi:hypothetical protein